MKSMPGRLALACVLCTAPLAAALTPEGEIVFAVTEGVTYQATPKEIRDKFTPLAEVLAKVAGHRVKTVIVPGYAELRAGLARQEYDIAFVHPAHVAMAEIKAGRYKAIAWTSGYTSYAVSILTPATGPLKTMADLKGRTLVTPDPDSITAAMVRAMFRDGKLTVAADHDASANAVRVITTRYQDSAPFYLEKGFAQAAATASGAVVSAWADKGGKVLERSRPVPIKQIIVSGKMPAEEQVKLREALLFLRDLKNGREAIDALGYKGFVPPSPEVERATMDWLGL